VSTRSGYRQVELPITPVYQKESMSSILPSYATDYLYQRRCVHTRPKPGVGRLVMHTLLARMAHPHAGMDGAACSATPQRCAEDEQEPARASLIEPGKQPCCPGAVGAVLIAKLGAQQPRFRTDAREERRDHERRQ
jgi:hypothetical protein